MNNIVVKTNLANVKLFNRGKVRDIYDLDDKLLIIATDRISAFDAVLPNGIPYKGKILNGLSVFWFNYTEDIAANHLISAELDDYPEILKPYEEVIAGRSMLVKKAERVDIECVVRGYLAGSAWREYKSNGTVCGQKLPEGLRESERLPELIFTPAIKASSGHDENISISKMKKLIGEELTAAIIEKSLAIFRVASEHAESCGLILCDTKFEFGIHNDKLIVIDEILTPDSSRFWSMEDYEPGRPQLSFDKQYTRDYLDELDWDKEPPAPELPEEVVENTSQKYLEAYRRIVGMENAAGAWKDDDYSDIVQDET